MKPALRIVREAPEPVAPAYVMVPAYLRDAVDEMDMDIRALKLICCRPAALNTKLDEAPALLARIRARASLAERGR